MKLFKKNENNQNKATQKLPMTGKVKRGFRFYCVAVLAAALMLGTSMTAFAANDPIAVVNNLSNFIGINGVPVPYFLYIRSFPQRLYNFCIKVPVFKAFQHKRQAD